MAGSNRNSNYGDRSSPAAGPKLLAAYAYLSKTDINFEQFGC